MFFQNAQVIHEANNSNIHNTHHENNLRPEREEKSSTHIPILSLMAVTISAS